MNILFLTLNRISNLAEKGIYTDLMREFIGQGHNVYIVVPAERRFHMPTSFFASGGAQILRVKTLNIQKTNLIEKGLGTLLLEYQYQKAIKKHWNNIGFDLILYSTPPITFNKVIYSLKKRYNSNTYLLLKDIFPQNAVDLGMFSKNSLFYKIFRTKERKLYELSDYIGCMSPANVEYVLKHNPTVKPKQVEVCPNSIKVIDSVSEIDKKTILNKLGVYSNKVFYIYGGNLGKPQGVDFLLDIVKANEKRENDFIIIVGSGTEYHRMQLWFEVHNPRNAILLASLPKQDYDALVRVCDVGLIFLDSRFSIPNYPSRLLSYLENKMPVLMATDRNTDIGKIAEINQYGMWTENGNIEHFIEMMDSLTFNEDRRKVMGKNGYKFLVENYTVEKGYEIIMKHFS